MSQRIAICIGVNKYKNISLANLNYAVRDAQEVATIIRYENRGSFNTVYELVDHDATKINIINTIRNVLLDESRKSDDLVLIYFSGHGALDKGDNLCLVTHDSSFRGRNFDVTTGVHIRELETLFDNSLTRSIVLILDACHSGGAGKLLGRIKYDDNSNFVVIGAARFSELAWETPEFGHGRFTECLLQTINQKPSEGEWITLSQVLTAIQSDMEDMEDMEGKQTVELSSHTINQKFLFFKNPAYSLASEQFIAQVKTLCKWPNLKIVPTKQIQHFLN